MSRRVDREEAAHLQYETEHTEPPKARSVVIYMAILVAAAFLLLLLAYIMQQRTASTVEGLHQSVNSFQTIDQLVEDNRTLQEEVTRLREEQAKLESELMNSKVAEERLADYVTSLSQSLQEAQENTLALAAVNQLRTLYNSGNYKEAYALLKDFPYDFDLETVLTRVSADPSTGTDPDVYDPLASYQRIAKLLGY